jgi:hypothetical protein
MIFRRLFSTLPNKSTHFIKNLLNVACIDCKNFQKHINLSEAGVSPVIQCSFHTFLITNSYMKSLLFVL